MRGWFTISRKTIRYPSTILLRKCALASRSKRPLSSGKRTLAKETIMTKKNKKKRQEDHSRNNLTSRDHLTPLNAPKREIVNAIEDMNVVRSPARNKKPMGKKNLSKQCDYHKDHDHTTEVCYHLKEEIEALIK